MTLKTLRQSRFSNQISGWCGGTGPSMVMIHGVGLQAEAWSPLVSYLEKHYTLTLVDLPGHGTSPAFQSQPKLRDYTSAIEDVLTKIDTPSIIVGHSMGALIAMDLAIHRPNLAAAIVPLNCIFKRTKVAQSAVVQRALDICNGTFNDPSDTIARWFGETPTDANLIAANLCTHWLKTVDPVAYGQAYSVFAQEDGPSKEDLESIKCPALFMTGSDEPNSTPVMSQRLARSVSNGQAIIVDGGKHMMPMTDAETVSAVMLGFLQDNGIVNGTT